MHSFLWRSKCRPKRCGELTRNELHFRMSPRRTNISLDWFNTEHILITFRMSQRGTSCSLDWITTEGIFISGSKLMEIFVINNRLPVSLVCIVLISRISPKLIRNCAELLLYPAMQPFRARSQESLRPILYTVKCNSSYVHSAILSSKPTISCSLFLHVHMQ